MQGDGLVPDNSYVLSERRTLLSSASPSLSAISGTGIANFVSSTSVSVTVTAKNSGGTNLGTGGDIFWITVSDKCSKTSNFVCTQVGGDTLSSDLSAIMTDNGDGTYSYTYTVTGAGSISVRVVLLHPNTILVNQYNGFNFNNLLGTVYWSNLNVNYSTGVLFNGRTDLVSMRFYAYLKAPYTGTISFRAIVDDGINFILDGVTKLANKPNFCS